MSEKTSKPRAARAKQDETASRDPQPGITLDLDRYVPAIITFIANKLSNSATGFYQRNFGINVTEWRIMSLLAIEPGIPASRICSVIGFDKGPVSRTLALMKGRGLIAIRAAPQDGRSHAISLTAKGRATHDKVIVVALGTRASAAGVPRQAGAGAVDHAVAAAPRQSRQRRGDDD